MSTGARRWQGQRNGFVCFGRKVDGARCHSIGPDYEGECTTPGCGGTDAVVLYAHDFDPAWRCPCGHRICLDHPPEIALFACTTCGTVQPPEPVKDAAGQQSMF